MANILAIDDDAAILQMIGAILRKDGHTVTLLSDPVKLDNTKLGFYDLILLDVMMPSIDGFSLCEKIRKLVDCPILFLTAKTGENSLVEGLSLGADDYISKPFGVMELISRVKALLRRTQSAAEETKICHGEIRMDNDKHAVFVGDEPCELTFKEYELLKYLMINAGIVLSRDKIMDQVWGFEYEGESRTVDMHIKTLRQKLGAAGSCIKTIRNVGYMIE